MPVRYLKHMMFAALVCSGLLFLFVFKGQMVSYLAVVIAYVFGVVFMSVVVVRLSVFKDYYKHDPLSLNVRNSSLVETRSAPVMSSIVTVFAFSAIMYIAEVSNPGIPIICSGITAGIMSFYHEGDARGRSRW